MGVADGRGEGTERESRGRLDDVGRVEREEITEVDLEENSL